ncbi:hypothetical protein [Luteimonas changyuni]|uniref:hypothetical protein n=1 Tax=Luteimonas sp. MJ145 TaxID=3129234 RepID=UPI0031BACFDE
MNHRLPVSLSSFLPALLMAGSMAAHGAVQAQAAAAVREATVREATVAQDAAPAEATPAPEAAPAWAPRTGDAVVDARLADINVYAARYPEAFIDELERYFDAPRPLLETLLGEGRTPGDLYYACALARVSGRPCRGVIEAWQVRGDGGWEAIARGFGVEPGDERAKRLRQGIQQSYAHWDRPLPGAE